MEVEFVEKLPPSSNERGKYADLIAVLKARPGEWALVAEVPNTKRHRSNPGPSSSLRKHGVRVSQRIDGDVIRVYAMWPGD